MDYKELLKRLHDHSQSLAAYNDQSLAHALEDAIAAIGAMLAERDAAIADIPIRCSKCKYYHNSTNEMPCNNCVEIGGDNNNWQWRGPQKSKEAHNA